MFPEGRKVARRRGVLLCAGAACSFATGPALVKGALLDGMGVWGLLASRMTIMSLIFGILAAARAGRGSYRPSRYAFVALALGAMGYSAQVALFTLALNRMSAAPVIILFNAFPIMVVAAAALMGRERLSRLLLFALGLGVGGVTLVALAHGSVTVDPIGIVMALGSGCGWAAIMLGADLLGDRLAPLPFATWLTVGAAGALVAATALVGFGGDGNAQGWLLTIALAVVPGVLATTLVVGGVARIGPSLASILLTLEPPLAVVIAWATLGERLTSVEILGAVLTLFAVLLTRRIYDGPRAQIEIAK